MVNPVALSNILDKCEERLPDETYSKMLYYLISSNGFKEKYAEESVAPENYDYLNCHKLALPGQIERLEHKLSFIEYLEKNAALYMIDPNEEIRNNLSKLQSVCKKDQIVSLLEAMRPRYSKSTSILTKTDTSTPCMYVTDLKKMFIKGGVKVDVNGTEVSFDKDTAITFNKPKKGQDYQVVVHKNGKIEAVFSEDLVNDTDDSVLIGGFHFAPGSNGSDESKGGDTTPQVNPYSIWDLRFRPIAFDPRGMALVDNDFWCDIYLMTDKGSRYGEPVKVNINWWDANAELHKLGKRCPSEKEFHQLAFGTTENKSSGTRIEKTGCVPEFTSKWGMMMSTGCYYVWGSPFMIQSLYNGKPYSEESK